MGSISLLGERERNERMEGRERGRDGKWGGRECRGEVKEGWRERGEEGGK